MISYKLAPCITSALVIFLCGVGETFATEPITARLHFKKLGRVILELGGPGSFDACNAKYPCVLRVGDEWWMWYNGRAEDCFTGQVGLAKSIDGLNWTKANNGQPVFRIGSPGTFDSTKVDHPAVVHFDGKFHMWYTAGGGRGSQYKIGYATSRDGLTWRRENNSQPILGEGATGKFDDRGVLHPAVVRDANGLLHLWYNGVGPQGFRIGHATSRDGIRWSRQNDGDPVLETSELDGRKEEYVYNVMVLLEGDTFHMWYSSMVAGKYKQYAPNSNAIVYASSKDGNNWKKDRQPVFYNGPRGSLDEYSAFACYVVRRENALWMYYSCGTLIDANDPRRFRTTLAIHHFSK